MNKTAIDLSNYNTSTEVYIRLRVVTGIHWQSDVAVDSLSILGGPITPNGVFLPIVTEFWKSYSNLQYSRLF